MPSVPYFYGARLTVVVMFEQLPETIPHKNKRKFEAFAGSFALQVVLVVGIIVLQMVTPEKLGEFQLLTTLHMAAPPPPPPAPISVAPERARRAEPKAATASQPTAVVTEQPRHVEKEPEVIAPTTIPKDIARLVESGAPSRGGNGVPSGIAGGVPGGISGGVGGGVLGGVLGCVATPPALPRVLRCWSTPRQKQYLNEDMNQPF
jgi:protein TonB